jgi:hypothetical protein
VVTDHEVGDPDPMRNYLRCLADPPDGVTHLCVLQDDALPCNDFARQVVAAVENRPDDMLSLFVGGLPGKTRTDFLRALKHGERWVAVYMQGIVHVVGLVWPVATAKAFLEWWPPAKPIPGARAPYRSDDMVVGYWAKTTKRQVWATVPCLVEHPDDVPSVAQTNRKADGQDRGRRAIHFVDSRT